MGCDIPVDPDWQTYTDTWLHMVRDAVGFPSSFTYERPCDADPGGCVLVAGLQEGGAHSWYVPLDIKEPTMSATPATGLTDGQSVTVSSDHMPATYDGPRTWIVETGDWVLAECDAGVADNPSLLGIFTACGTSVGGPVTSFGPINETVTATSHLDRILGGTTDCASGPGACVLALVRMEWNGKVTVHSTPLTFA